jgi:hypothetical protein
MARPSLFWAAGAGALGARGARRRWCRGSRGAPGAHRAWPAWTAPRAGERPEARGRGASKGAPSGARAAARARRGGGKGGPPHGGASARAGRSAVCGMRARGPCPPSRPRAARRQAAPAAPARPSRVWFVGSDPAVPPRTRIDRAGAGSAGKSRRPPGSHGRCSGAGGGEARRALRVSVGRGRRGAGALVITGDRGWAPSAGAARRAPRPRRAPPGARTSAYAAIGRAGRPPWGPRAPPARAARCAAAADAAAARRAAAGRPRRVRPPPPTLPPRCPSWPTPHSDNSKKKDVREFNIEAAKAVADSVRTSLGPRGLDKMVRGEGVWGGGGASTALRPIPARGAPAAPPGGAAGPRPAAAPRPS